MRRIVERHWRCDECGEVIRGRHKNCPNDGAPREAGEMLTMHELERWNADGTNAAATVANPDLLDLATAGRDWFCAHCSGGNRGDDEICSNCLAPRHEPVVVPPPVRRPRRRRSRPVRRLWTWMVLVACAGGALLTIGTMAVAGFSIIVWALQTQEIEGTVHEMAWSQHSIRQHWTDIDVRSWKRETLLRSEIKPVDGVGGQAGMVALGQCREERHHYEQYQCGTRPEPYDCSYTESYQDTCNSSEQYPCGETCADNGNGFSTCSTRYCTRMTTYSCTKSRRVPKTCERTVPKYCDRPIYATKCAYRTQGWKNVETKEASGKGLDTEWPLLELGPLDRQGYSADYTITIRYERHEAQPHTQELKPGKARMLGHKVLLTQQEAEEVEAAYRDWTPDETVVVKLRNLGGVQAVLKGDREIKVY